MSKLSPADITVTDVNRILQSSEDAIAAFTAQKSLVKRLHQQNKDLIARQLVQQQESELKPSHTKTKGSTSSVSNEAMLKHQNMILQAQIKLLQMRLTQEKENASNERLSKLNVIKQLKRKVQTFMDTENPTFPPSPLRSGQRYKIPRTVTKECGPYHPTFNPPEAANLVLQTPVKPTVSPIVPSQRVHASSAAQKSAVASPFAAPSTQFERVLSVLNEHLRCKINNSVTKLLCTRCNQGISFEEVKEHNMNFTGFTSGTKCLLCETLDHTDFENDN